MMWPHVELALLVTQIGASTKSSKPIKNNHLDQLIYLTNQKVVDFASFIILNKSWSKVLNHNHFIESIGKIFINLHPKHVVQCIDGSILSITKILNSTASHSWFLSSVHLNWSFKYFGGDGRARNSRAYQFKNALPYKTLS
jgi:hypothetical protein